MMIEERTKANVRVLKLAYGGLLVALGILLPQAFHIFGQNAGMIFLPIQIPVLFAGMLLGPYYGGLIGIDRDATGAEGLFYVCGVDGIRDCSRMDDKKNKRICKSPYGNDFRESGVWYFFSRGSAAFAYTGALSKSGGIFIGDCLRRTGNADSDCDSSGIVSDVKARRSDI